MCETRFVQRHDSILKFGENFHKITEGLGKILIDASFDTNTRSRTLSLLKAVCSSSFLVATAAAVKIMAVTQPLSKILQKVQLCYAEAADCVEEARNTLSSWRSDGNEWEGNYFSVFNTVQRYADIASIEIKKPRCPSRLVYRSSFKDCTDKDYFKYSVRYPYLDSIIAEFATKFSEKSLSAYKLISVLLSSTVDVSDGLTVFKMYGRLIHNQEQALLEELKAFSEYRAKNFPDEQKLTKLLLDTPARFESVRKLLQIALTLPVTYCEAEMSFSAMKILKNRLQSTMVDERLNGLAHK